MNMYTVYCVYLSADEEIGPPAPSSTAADDSDDDMIGPPLPPQMKSSTLGEAMSAGETIHSGTRRTSDDEEGSEEEAEEVCWHHHLCSFPSS